MCTGSRHQIEQGGRQKDVGGGKCVAQEKNKLPHTLHRRYQTKPIANIISKAFKATLN
jgi:hypothetical protein